MNQRRGRSNQFGQCFCKLSCLRVLTKHVFAETETLQLNHCLKLDADLAEGLRLHLAIDELKVFELIILLNESDQVSLSLRTQWHILHYQFEE